MREIIFDTETTGLNPAAGDRMVEIGCIELVNRVETGRSFHAYFNPDRPMPSDAEAVHGLTDIFLSDKPRFAEKAGIPRPNFERHQFFEPFYGINAAAADTPEAYQRYEAAAPITYLTKDDPPALLNYSYQNVEVTNTSDLGLVVHHPKLGIALKDQMDKLGIECIVQYRAAEGNKTQRHGGGDPIGTVDFIKKHFAAATK